MIDYLKLDGRDVTRAEFEAAKAKDFDGYDVVEWGAKMTPEQIAYEVFGGEYRLWKLFWISVAVAGLSSAVTGVLALIAQ